MTTYVRGKPIWPLHARNVLKNLEKYQQDAPVDVRAIAGALGINVWDMKSLDEHTLGKLFPDPKNGGSSGYSIGVNRSEPYERKRFTVAHEIAHYLLHKDRIGAGISEGTFGGSKIETEANQLAAEILMPRSLIEKLQAGGATTISELSARLQVSKIAVEIRLEGMKGIR